MHHLAIRRLIGICPEDCWEALNLQTAQQNMGIGDRQWPPAAVAGWARISSGRAGTNQEATTIAAKN